MRKLNWALPIFICTTLGILFGVVFACNMKYDFLPIWQKLPSLPDRAVKIINVEWGNVLIKTENGKTYRCPRDPSNLCWTENLKLDIPSWGNPEWQYDFRKYESCDHTKPYFLSWKIFPVKIIDCVMERETFVHWWVVQTIVVDADGNVWNHSSSWDGMISLNFMLIAFSGIFGFIGFVVGVVFTGIQTIVRKRRAMSIV
jgi:hypothetical protein